MNWRLPNIFRILLGIVIGCSVAGLGRAHTVIELRPAVYNHLFGTSASSEPNGTNGPVVPPGQPKFAAVGATSGSSAAVSPSAALTTRYPVSTSGAFILKRSAFGNGFAMASPRFLMGHRVPTPSAAPVTGVALGRFSPVNHFSQV